MLGFAVLISENLENLEEKFVWKPVFDFQTEHILRTTKMQNVYAEQTTAKRFIDEKLWLNTDDYFIVIEGVITNLELLCKRYNTKDYQALILKMSKQEKFFNEFTGNFAGYIFLKQQNKHILFNNHAASKKVFYFHNKNIAVFSTDLFTISQKLNDLGISKTLDIEASYFLLTSGFMHENLTLIEEVKQLRAGEYLIFENYQIKTDFYFHLNNIEQTQDNANTIIENLDEKFKNAVSLEFQQDTDNNYTSASTLSGGLDSRMTTLIAHKNYFRNIECICFCEKKYADEIIALQIAKSYNLKIQTYTLTPNSLTAIDDVIKVNDGLAIYSGAGHAFEALQNFNLNNIGFLHTGMIGDAVMGSFLKNEYETNPLPSDGGDSQTLLPKVEYIFQKYIKNYKNIETYKFYNRATLRANSGFLYFDLAGESASPFLEPDFMIYAFSIPPKMRYKERIYIDWIKKKHPDIAQFVWENQGGKPTNNALLKNYYRYKRAIIKRLPIPSMWKNGMSPEQLWFDSTPEVKKILNDYFEENIYRIENYPELQKDSMFLYKIGNVTEKTQVLTLLGAVKLLF
ncbi:MAG: hypothetical protein LBR36_07290 [Bacteroidales bacterium]|jgi:asparagine synthase (glutamine-hydrolysing)|nr:hypothetical protein [Bacteroidales bacterium]